ncbi:MAG: ATP F0F1 synthase subunit B [Pseudomonadota bacterium]
MDILQNSNFVVFLSFSAFFGLLYYLGVHKFLGKALDDRAEGIRNDLAEARRLREEAQEVFANFERKQHEVKEQAEEIVSHAKREAEAAAEQAKADLEVSIQRRLRRAEEQIAMAEQSAVKEVRDSAAQIAVAAAADVLAANMDASKANTLIDASIEQVGAQLN